MNKIYTGNQTAFIYWFGILCGIIIGKFIMGK